MIRPPHERRPRGHFPPIVGGEPYRLRWLDWLITIAVVVMVLAAFVAALSNARPYEGRVAVLGDK